MIATEFGKFRYNRLPMSMCNLGDLFQAKVAKLLVDIQGFKTCIDGILFLSNEGFSKPIKQTRVVFGRLRAAGLEVNSPKLSYGLNEIPYLGYVISREGIKPDTEKVQGIMDLGRTTTTTEAQSLIGMVNYYRDMWPIRSHILAPMIETSSGIKGIKTPCNDALEDSLQELNRMVSADTVLSYLYWKIPFTVHTDASYKQLDAIISHNNKPTVLS